MADSEEVAVPKRSPERASGLSRAMACLQLLANAAVFDWVSHDCAAFFQQSKRGYKQARAGEDEVVFSSCCGPVGKEF